MNYEELMDRALTTICDYHGKQKIKTHTAWAYSFCEKCYNEYSNQQYKTYIEERNRNEKAEKKANDSFKLDMKYFGLFCLLVFPLIIIYIVVAVKLSDFLDIHMLFTTMISFVIFYSIFLLIFSFGKKRYLREKTRLDIMYQETEE